MKDGNSGYCFRNHLSRVRDWFQNLESARTILSNSLLIRVFPKYPLLCALSWILILATTGIFQPVIYFRLAESETHGFGLSWVENFPASIFQKRVKSVLLRLADGLAKACPLETILLFNAGAHLGLFSRGCQYTTSLRNGCPHCNHIHINSCLAIQSISNLPTGPIVFGRTEILEAFIFG